MDREQNGTSFGRLLTSQIDQELEKLLSAKHLHKSYLSDSPRGNAPFFCSQRVLNLSNNDTDMPNADCLKLTLTLFSLNGSRSQEN